MTKPCIQFRLDMKEEKNVNVGRGKQASSFVAI